MKNLSSKSLLFKFLAGTILICFSLKTYAQIEVEPTGPLFSPESLITNVFLGEGVEVTNLTYNGSEQAVGYFTNGLDDVGIDRGIIMSSGFATTAATANTAGGTTGNTTGAGNDPDLDPIAGANGLNDIAKYEITFIPTNDTLQFKYVFASEEYPEYACSPFNDVFGFFLTGPNPAGGMYTGENIALVPDPADPTGQTFTNIPVTINNVNNQGVNPPGGCNFDYGLYYNDNSGSMTLTYDAYLNIFIAQAIVTPCEEYTIKLAVADVGDGAFDTGVFLEAKSFGTGALEVEFASISLDGTITEDCASATLTFELPSPSEADYPIDYTIIGTAENGVDYQQIPLDLTIPQGDTAVTVDVIAWEDGIPESVETIGIDVQRDPCNRDTFWLFIRDNELVPPELGPDTTICQRDSVQLDGTLPITLPDPPTFSNDTDMPIVTISNNNPPPPGTLPTQSEIQVFGVQPVELQAGVIKRICVDVDHSWISDVDVFLVGPNGQFIELTTDNGGSGNDMSGTCFTPLATDPINFGSQAPPSAAPFNGDWLPEGNWEDLWTIQDPLTNGIWTLQLKDDQTGFNGTLLGWSICFNPVYQIFYEWTPSAGLSCDDCPDPVATPDTTTTYYLTAYDTYGCEVYDTITINVLEQLPAPVVTCGNITDSSIEFCWDAIPDSDGYEVNVDGMGWITSNDSLCHNVTGLTLEDTVFIQVRGIGECDGMIDTLSCWTPSCTPPTGSIISQTDADCFGASTGTATIEAMGTYPPFEYMIEGIDTNFTGVFNNLPAGNYSVLVLDTVNCPLTIPLTINEPTEIITSEVLVNNASCNGGNDGSVTVTVTGGTAPYSFIWSNTQLDSIATGLAVGEYYVSVTDLNGCSVIDTVNVTQPPVMSLTTEADSVSCNGLADGTATVIVDGGVGPYDYQWDANTSNQTTPTAFGLSGGIYTVTVSDQNNCTEEINVEVIENAAITLVTSGTDISCFNGDDGVAIVTASGGTGVYTYEWNDAGMQTTDTAVGLTEGMVTVLVTDSDGCFVTADVTLNQPTALDVSTQTSDAFCNGSNDGVITIITNGGTLPYTYDWADDPGIPDSLRNDLLAGDYTITVTDGNGCSEIINAAIGEPDSIDLVFLATNVNCNAGTDGFASVNPSGGTAPYTFQWDANANNQTTQLATDLAAGTYFVTVSDNSGCTSVSSIDISEPDVLALSDTPVDVLCFGNGTGSIDLDITGGTTPYTIAWTGPNAYSSSDEDINDLFSGTYDVLVTDDNGCTATLAVTIDQPATGIMSTVSAPDSVCFAAETGTVSVTVGGGTGPFTYEWNTSETTPVISNLGDGIYIVTITDSGNCTFVDTAYVIEKAEIIVALSQTAALCHDSPDGTASVASIQAGGNNLPITDFDILWSNGDPTVTSTNLIGGQSYTVTVTNIADGCTGTAAITIDNPVEISILLDNTTDASCFGESDGTATVLGDGGVAPYTYQWDVNANNQTTSLATGLPAGTYFVTVSDDNGCTSVSSVDIDQPDVLALSNTPVDVLCFGNSTGSIDLEINGGTTPYVIAWTGPNAYSSSDEDINNLFSGTYDVLVTDGNGCTATLAITIDQPATGIMSTISEPDSICFEAGTGTVSVSVGGGTGPFTYEWNTSATTPSLSNLDGGMYIVTITDSGNCTFIDTTYVVEQGEITINLSQTAALCHNGPDGTATIASIQTGNINSPIADFDILWSNGAPTVTSTNLTGGQTYSVTVTNVDGCTGTAAITIDNPAEIGARIDETTDVSCFGGSDGTAIALGEGGVAPYTYQWDFNANNQTTSTAVDLSAGNYLVTVTDNNGCFTIISTMIGQPPRLELSFETEGTECFGEANGSARATTTGGTPAFTYEWSNGGTEAAIESVVGGTYSLTVTDQNGCTIVDNAIVAQPDELEAQIDQVDVTCFEGRDGEIIFLPQGGTAPYTYSLDGETFNGSTIQIGLTAGTYPAYILDAHGCEQYLGDYTVNEPDQITVDLGPTIVTEYGTPVILEPNVSGGFGNLSFSYNQEDSLTLNCLLCKNPEASPEYTTNYEVLVTDENGCTGEAFVMVLVEKDRPVYVPTGFTPNGDGNNDVLLIHGKQIENILAFRVYDRWGELVHEALEYSYDASSTIQGWNGRFKGEPMNPGVYVWFVEIEYVDGTTDTFKGNTTLIR